jgi:plasmid stabilization system protein ParE
MVLNIRPEARLDLARIAAGLREDKAFLEAARCTIQLIHGWPLIGRRRRFRQEGVRSFIIRRPFNKWVVFYQVTDTSVDIVRVLDGRRDLAQLFE